MSFVKYNFQLSGYQYPLVCERQDIAFLEEQEKKLNDLFHTIILQYNFDLKQEDVLLLMVFKLIQEQKESTGAGNNSYLEKEIYLALCRGLGYECCEVQF